MPNPKDLVSEEQIDQQIAAGHLQPIEAPVINPNAPRTGPVVPGNSGRDPYESGSLPPNFGLETDLYRTDYGGSVPEDRLMPIQGGPGANAKTANIATHIVNQAIAAIPPVVIPSTVATPIPFLVDHFIPSSGNTTGAPSVSPSVSSSVTGWFLPGTATGDADFIANYLMGAPPNLGQLNWINVLTKNHVATAWPGPVGSQMSAGQRMTGFMPLLDYPSWHATFIFKFDGFPNGSSTSAFSTTNCTFYVGLTGDFLPSAQTRPNCFIGLRFDTDTNAPSIADSFFTLEVVNNLQTSTSFVRNNTQGTTLVTNVAPVAGVWHTLTISCTVAGTVTLTLDGSTTNTLTASVPPTTINDTAGDASAASTNNGAQIGGWSTTHGVPNFADGSKITISGITTVGYTFLNGSWVTTFSSNSPVIQFLTTTSVGNSNISAWTLVGLPGLMPFMTGGNDNTGASPSTGSIGFFLDDFTLLLS